MRKNLKIKSIGLALVMVLGLVACNSEEDVKVPENTTVESSTTIKETTKDSKKTSKATTKKTIKKTDKSKKQESKATKKDKQELSKKTTKVEVKSTTKKDRPISTSKKNAPLGKIPVPTKKKTTTQTTTKVNIKSTTKDNTPKPLPTRTNAPTRATAKPTTKKVVTTTTKTVAPATPTTRATKAPTTTTTTVPTTQAPAPTIDEWEVDWNSKDSYANHFAYTPGDKIFYARDYGFDINSAENAAIDYIDNVNFDLDNPLSKNTGGNYYSLYGINGNIVAYGVHFKFD